MGTRSAESTPRVEGNIQEIHANEGASGVQLVDDARSIDGGRPVTVGVMANDTFAPVGAARKPLLSALGGSSHTLTLNSEPHHGSAVINGDDVTYTPSPTYVGEDEFSYKVTIQRGPTGTRLSEGTAVVRITTNTPAVGDGAE
ncbi:Ig-like domain-containing protein [Streptomyces sp. NPDC088745]|uniref:Ig-like domain-containing protein n=1 Tax=Streptomyces sp. NPDC088745 TaxID=3365884 RepID=UPI00380B106B